MDTHSIDQLIAKVNANKMEADLADLVKLDPPSTTNTVTNTLDYAFAASHISDCNFGNILLLYVYKRQGVVKGLRQERITQSNPRSGSSWFTTNDPSIIHTTCGQGVPLDQ